LLLHHSILNFFILNLWTNVIILLVHYGLCLILCVLMQMNIWLIICGIWSLINILLIKMCGEIRRNIALLSKLTILQLIIKRLKITISKAYLIILFHLGMIFVMGAIHCKVLKLMHNLTDWIILIEAHVLILEFTSVILLGLIELRTS